MSSGNKHILLASPDSELVSGLESAMSDSSLNLVSAIDGVEAIYVAEKYQVSVVVLDSSITKIPAQQVAALIKRLPALENTHVFLLHPEKMELDTNGWVDQYILKPINTRSLAAKIKAATRINVKTMAAPSLKRTVGALTVDRDTYMVHYKGAEILLPRKEFELIYLLASRPEKVFTREEIFKHIWHKEITPKEGRTIDVHIRKLRSKISENLITTIKGIGYKIM